ncbi:MAG: hypothetical protein N2445_06035, partial [Acidobacteria bacterium]|nr:hypothetical protein [Acidobacteriota bacterium]
MKRKNTADKIKISHLKSIGRNSINNTNTIRAMAAATYGYLRAKNEKAPTKMSSRRLMPIFFAFSAGLKILR